MQLIIIALAFMKLKTVYYLLPFDKKNPNTKIRSL